MYSANNVNGMSESQWNVLPCYPQIKAVCFAYPASESISYSCII